MNYNIVWQFACEARKACEAQKAYAMSPSLAAFRRTCHLRASTCFHSTFQTASVSCKQLCFHPPTHTNRAAFDNMPQRMIPPDEVKWPRGVPSDDKKARVIAKLMVREVPIDGRHVVY